MDNEGWTGFAISEEPLESASPRPLLSGGGDGDGNGIKRVVGRANKCHDNEYMMNRLEQQQRQPMLIGGGRGAGPEQFSCPFGIAVFPPENLLIVADSGNHRLQIIDPLGISSLSLNDHQALPTPAPPSAATPTPLADSQYNNNQGRAKFISSIGSGPGNGASELNSPDGVVVLSAASRHLVVVSDYNNHRLQVVDVVKGVFVRQIGNGQGRALNQLNGPSGLAVLPRPSKSKSLPSHHGCGHDTEQQPNDTQHPNSSSSLQASTTSSDLVAVCDYLNHRIQIIDPHSGSFIRAIGGASGPGSGPNDFHSPQSITVLNDGHLLVSDTWNHRLQMIDPISGTFVRSIGPQQGVKAPLSAGYSSLPASPSSSSSSAYVQFGSSSTATASPVVAAAATTNEPTTGSDTAVASSSASSTTGCLLNLSSLSSVLPSSPSPTSLLSSCASPQYTAIQTPPGRLHYPHGLVALPNGHVAACVSYNHRIQIVDPTNGDLHAIVGTGRGSHPGQFNRPFGMAVVAAPLSSCYGPDQGKSSSPSSSAVPQSFSASKSSSSASVTVDLDRPMMAHFLVVSDAWNHRLQIVDLTTVLKGWVPPTVVSKVLSCGGGRGRRAASIHDESDDGDKASSEESNQRIIPRSVLPVPLIEEMAECLSFESGGDGSGRGTVGDRECLVAKEYYEEAFQILRPCNNGTREGDDDTHVGSTGDDANASEQRNCTSSSSISIPSGGSSSSSGGGSGSITAASTLLHREQQINPPSTSSSRSRSRSEDDNDDDDGGLLDASFIRRMKKQESMIKNKQRAPLYQTAHHQMQLQIDAAEDEDDGDDDARG